MVLRQILKILRIPCNGILFFDIAPTDEYGIAKGYVFFNLDNPKIYIERL